MHMAVKKEVIFSVHTCMHMYKCTYCSFMQWHALQNKSHTAWTMLVIFTPRWHIGVFQLSTLNLYMYMMNHNSLGCEQPQCTVHPESLHAQCKLQVRIITSSQHAHFSMCRFCVRIYYTRECVCMCMSITYVGKWMRVCARRTKWEHASPTRRFIRRLSGFTIYTVSHSSLDV
jgi:hypothetical protein